MKQALDVPLTALLDGPQPTVQTPPEARRRWLKRKWATESHHVTEGSFLTLTAAGRVVAEATVERQTALLRAAVNRHPDLVIAFDDPNFGLFFEGFNSLTKGKAA